MPPAPADSDVTLKGKSLRAAWVRGDPARRTAPQSHPPLAADEALLIGYAQDRILHHWSEGRDAGFDVVWISKDLKVVETALLPPNSERGVTSASDVRYALLLRPGWVKAQGVKAGDDVGLGASILSRPPDPLPEVRIADAGLRVEVSSKDHERMRGLMHRRAMSAGDGMLFVYANPHPLSFWMGHCHYPLDIAYFDEGRRLLNVVEIGPYADPEVDTGERAHSQGDAKYVIEANRGWFRARGLTGADGLPQAPALLQLPSSLEKIVDMAD